MTGTHRAWQRGDEEFERTLGAPGPESHLVRLLGTPLRLWGRTSEHHEELMREFALITLGAAERDLSLPGRLIQLITDVRARYGNGSPADLETREAALAAGLKQIDLTYRVPGEVRDACLTLGSLLDEADAYCAADGFLLTLTTPSDALAFRRWFLAEFVRQIDGEAPQPWPGGVD